MMRNRPEQESEICLNFALKAFEENACDYILKPFSDKRFYAALEKARRELEDKNKIEQLQKYLRNEGRYIERLSINLGKQVKIINIDDVLYFSSKEHMTFAHTKEENHICDYSLKHLEEYLPPEQFIRIHRNTIITRSSSFFKFKLRF